MQCRLVHPAFTKPARCYLLFLHALAERNRYERPTQLYNDPLLEQALNEVEYTRHRNRIEHGSPEAVPDLESGFPPRCMGLTCLGEETEMGDGFRFSHSRGKRSEVAIGGTGTLDKLGGANLIRKRFFQPEVRNREPSLDATWHLGRNNAEDRDSIAVDFSKRGLFDSFFSTPRPSFDSRVAKEHPFLATSQSGLFKDYNSLLQITPAPPTQSSFSLGNLFWGGQTNKRTGHLDRLGGANLVKRRDSDDGYFESVGGGSQENGVQDPRVFLGEDKLSLAKSRIHNKPSEDGEVLFDFLKGTVVGQDGDSVDFGFIHGEPYLKSSRVDSRISGDNPFQGFLSNDYIENLEKSNLQRRGYLDSLGGSNLQKRRVLDQLGGQNLQKRLLDSLGGQNLQKREYLDALGGQNLQKRYLERQSLRKRYLDSLGGQNLQKKSHLDSLGGQNLQKRNFFDFLGDSSSDEGLAGVVNDTNGPGNRVDEIIYVSHSVKRNVGNETTPDAMGAVAKVEIIGTPQQGENKELFRVNLSEGNNPTKFTETSSSQNLDPLGGANLIRNLDALDA